MRMLVLFGSDESVASILDIPAHATARAVCRIVSCGLALAAKHGLNAAYLAESGEVIAWSHEHLSTAGRLLDMAEARDAGVAAYA